MDYDCMILYHLGKVHVVVEALSKRALSELRIMFICLSLFNDVDILAKLQVKPI